jgi:integrase
MKKLTLPKNSHKGLKIFCRTCRVDNSKCKHFDRQVYRVRIHVPGTINSTKSYYLEAENYNDAVIECALIEKELIQNGFEKINQIDSESLTDYSIVDAVVKYREYMSGESKYAHLKKNISQGHIDECVRFCWKFLENVSLLKNVNRMRPSDIKIEDVSNFYIWAEENYSSKTFNKCFIAVRSFFEFLIEVENIEIKNPFRKFTPKLVNASNIDIITEDEFNRILSAVDTFNPIIKLGGKGKIENRYKPFLKDGFKLFLLTGGRREEVVDLKWSDIYCTPQGVKLFIIDNLKVNRIKKDNKDRKKYIAINVDLEEFLIELGMNEKIGKNEYILLPERDRSTKTLMNDLSKGFTHFKIGAGIAKDISLSNLRKTYLTWHHQVLGDDTGLVSSHSTTQVLEKYYLDPKVLTAVEVSALKVRVFGKSEKS